MPRNAGFWVTVTCSLVAIGVGNYGYIDIASILMLVALIGWSIIMLSDK